MDADHFAYLDNTAGNWPSCLANSLGYVRQSWAGQWVGLPRLLERCVDFLSLNGSAQSRTTAALLAAARDLAAQIETESAYGAFQAEPAYHNRLHFADVLTAITLQLALEDARCDTHDADWQAALLLIAVAHDFRHCGGVNAYAAQMEQQSFDALQPFLLRHGVAPNWLDRIHTVIVRSDFAAVPENHRRVSGQKFAWCTDWACVLLNEADTMASASPTLGRSLGEALAAEWARAKLPAHGLVATAQGRGDFLKAVAFSSYSAEVLGAPEAVAAQLAEFVRTTA